MANVSASEQCMEFEAPIDLMTSREFQQDTNAHLDNIGKKIKSPVISVFRNAILHNKHLFRGRTVLDVGCGVGLLSLFAAKAGASRVYAIDKSNAADYAKRLSVANGYGDIICVLKGKVQDLELPGADKVDIIVSNWLGYSLLSESICDEVLDARDKWLRTNGLIFPDVAYLYVLAVEDYEHRGDLFNWWYNVYGFNMRCISKDAFAQPYLQRVQPKQIISGSHRIRRLNLRTAKKTDIFFRNKFELKVFKNGNVDGLATFFHVLFTQAHTLQSFNTHPLSPHTEWMQSVFYFKEPLHVKAGDVLYGGIEMIPHNTTKCNFNDIDVNAIIYSGIIPDLTLELEMSWRMKTYGLSDVELSNGIHHDTVEQDKEEFQDDERPEVQLQSITLSNFNGNETETTQSFYTAPSFDVVNEDDTISGKKSKNKRNSEFDTNIFFIIGDQQYPIEKPRYRKQHNKNNKINSKKGKKTC